MKLYFTKSRELKVENPPLTFYHITEGRNMKQSKWKKRINTHEYQTYNSQTGNKKLEESIIYYKMWTKICLGNITAVDFVITHVCRCKLVIVHISALYSECIIYFNTTPTRFDRSPIFFCFFWVSNLEFTQKCQLQYSRH